MSDPSSPPMNMVPSPFVHDEVALFVGIAFESIFYGTPRHTSPKFALISLVGITFLLFCLTMRNLLMRGGMKRTSGSLWALMGFLTVQQIALLIAVLSNIQFCVLAFVYHRDTPGGPVVYQIMNSNVAPAYASISAYSVCNWLQDVVLVSASPRMFALISYHIVHSCIASVLSTTSGVSHSYSDVCYS